MGLPKSVRLDDELERQIEEYLEANGLKFTQLVNMALTKFITEPQTIRLAPVETKDFLTAAQSAFKRHKGAMDKLK